MWSTLPLVIAFYVCHLRPISLTEGEYFLLALLINHSGYDFFVIMMQFATLFDGAMPHIELSRPRDLVNLDSPMSYDENLS